ncbi:MAG: DNA-protecting protein DprA [Desulfarculus sp.]|nr:DNA-protecting protein DprA [Desulfarculus sp.]
MPNERRQTLDWLGLRLIPGVGSVTFDRLRRAFGSPGAALGAPLKALCGVAGLKEEVALAVHNKAFAADPGRELERLKKLGGRVVTLEDPEYPPPLASIYAPPPLLFVRGGLAGCRAGGVALVGSREMTAYGRRVAENLAGDLARAGVSVISGLARGVDTVAHQAALAAGGHTVGVLGSGLNVTYPAENGRIMAEMARQGAVISEFPLGTRPAPANFPVRNRIISGLSRAVVVVEAGLKSGSLITARHALDQGREVLAVPGPLGAPGSQGCHELIRQGARLLTSAQDLLAPGALPPLLALAAPAAEEPPDLPAPAAELLGLLGPEPVHVDVLVRQSGLRPQEVTALLVNLEMAGLVDQRPGKHYIRSQPY